MMWIKKNITLLLLSAFIVIGAVLRFYNLTWSAPYYFHPDERNIATAISQLNFPEEMNPHFFAYGSLPIYTAYGIGLLQNSLLTLSGKPFSTVVSFEQAIGILRFFSAFFSVILIPLLFFLGTKIKNKKTGLFAAFFVVTSIGLIQYAHFGTFELWLTFLSVLLFISHIYLWHTKQIRYTFLQAVIFGLLVSTKISSLAFFPLLFLHPVLWQKKTLTFKVVTLARHLFIVAALTLILFLLINPFSYLDFTSFYNSISYESEVATGELEVFYTGEFVDTTPIIYQLIHIYPFLLNPLLTAFMIPALIVVFIKAHKEKNTGVLLLLAYTTLLFLSQAVLFVKWTRYLIPTLPFLYLLLALFTDDMREKITRISTRGVSTVLILLGGVSCALFALAFFITVYIQPDTRVQAAVWAEKHIEQDALLLSETYDLGIIPFNERFSQIELFNFYDLDTASAEFNTQTLTMALQKHDYLILPSQRLIKSRLLHPEDYPHGSQFYTDLFQGQTQFTTLYTSPCNLWCQITYWGDPIFNFEGTVNVFDRPTVFMFKNTERTVSNP